MPFSRKIKFPNTTFPKKNFAKHYFSQKFFKNFQLSLLTFVAYDMFMLHDIYSKYSSSGLVWYSVAVLSILVCNSIHFLLGAYFTRLLRASSVTQISVYPCSFCSSKRKEYRLGWFFPMTIRNLLCQPSDTLFVRWLFCTGSTAETGTELAYRVHVLVLACL